MDGEALTARTALDRSVMPRQTFANPFTQVKTAVAVATRVPQAMHQSDWRVYECMPSSPGEGSSPPKGMTKPRPIVKVELN